MKFLHSQSRIEGFSDAVFALAATLMVVSLDSPENFNILDEKFIGLLGFGISFFALVMIWMVHYNFFRRTTYVDGYIIAYNMILLFVILYFVFPLKTMISSWFSDIGLTTDSLAALFKLYGIGFCLIFSCFTLLYYRAFKKDRKEHVNLKLYFLARHFTIFVIIGLVSVFFATTKIGIKIALPGPIYALLGPLCYWHGKWFEKKYGVV